MWQSLQAGSHGNTGFIATALMAVLPRENELTAPERIALIKEFCRPIRDVGHVIDWNMHRGRNGNWHVHFLVSMSGMSRDERTEALRGSPFRVSMPWVPDKETGQLRRHVINPPWQRLWRVAQERFFRRRGIALRIPASTAIIRHATANQRAIALPPASSRGYASDTAVTDWHERRRNFFSNPSFYLAALTRDRLIIDQRDSDTFNAMIWGKHPVPEPITRLFRSNRVNESPDIERVGNGRAVRFGNGVVTSYESFDLLYRAMLAAQYLDYTPFIDDWEEFDDIIALDPSEEDSDAIEVADAGIDLDNPPLDIGSRFSCVVCTESIGMVSAAKSEHLLPVGKKGFEETGLKGLLPVLERATQHVELLFIAADHISFSHYDSAIKKREWQLIGIHAFLRGEFEKAFLSNETYSRRGVMLVVLDAQRISDPRLAALICMAEKLQRRIGCLRLLLMKPDDVTAEPNAPLLDWLSRSLRHYHFSDPSANIEIVPAQRRNTFDFRFSGGRRAPRERDLVFDDLPSEFTRTGASRQARYAAALAYLSAIGALRENPKSPSHPLIIVGSRPDPHLSALDRLRPGGRVLVTEDLPDEGLSAGTILTIGDGEGENRAFFYREPGGNGQNAVDAKLAHHFLPIDMMSVREAYQVMDHIDAIRAQGDCKVFVIVNGRDHAESLLSFASSLDRAFCQVIIDKRLCCTPDQLMSLIDQNSFSDALDSLASVVAAEPEIAALARNHPDNYYASAAADEFLELQGEAMGEAMIAQEPQIRPANQVPMHADNYDDAADFEALAEGNLFEDDFDFEDDPDAPLPEIWDDEKNHEPDDEPGVDYDD